MDESQKNEAAKSARNSLPAPWDTPGGLAKAPRKGGSPLAVATESMMAQDPTRLRFRMRSAAQDGDAERLRRYLTLDALHHQGSVSRECGLLHMAALGQRSECARLVIEKIPDALGDLFDGWGRLALDHRDLAAAEWILGELGDEPFADCVARLRHGRANEAKAMCGLPKARERWAAELIEKGPAALGMGEREAARDLAGWILGAWPRPVENKAANDARAVAWCVSRLGELSEPEKGELRAAWASAAGRDGGRGGDHDFLARASGGLALLERLGGAERSDAPELCERVSQAARGLQEISEERQWAAVDALLRWAPREMAGAERARSWAAELRSAASSCHDQEPHKKKALRALAKTIERMAEREELLQEASKAGGVAEAKGPLRV
jgi:hypothetical protein